MNSHDQNQPTHQRNLILVFDVKQQAIYFLNNRLSDKEGRIHITRRGLHHFYILLGLFLYGTAHTLYMKCYIVYKKKQTENIYHTSRPSKSIC